MNINKLKKLCDAYVSAGYGDKEILLSGDDEGNSYHGLYFGFTKCDGVFADDVVELCDDYTVTKENIKDYIVLG